MKRILLDADSLVDFRSLLPDGFVPKTIARVPAAATPGWIPSRPRRKSDRGGRLITTAEARRLDGPLASFPSTLVLSEGESGLEPVEINLVIPASIRERHLLAFGKTGSGKTTKFLLSMLSADLQDPERSSILADAKGDLAGPALELVEVHRGKGAKVFYLNALDPTRSIGWNPLGERISRETAAALATCLANAHPPGRNETPFFRNGAIEVLTEVFEVISGGEKASLAAVAQMFHQGLSDLGSELDQLGLGHLETVRYADSNTNAQTTVMEIRNYLAPFLSPDVAAVTSKSEFRFDDLLAEPSVLIIAMQEGERRLQGIHSIFVMELFRWVVDRSMREKTRRLPRPVSCFLDEFASAIGVLPEIERALNTFRSRNFSFVAAVQSLGQIRHVYGPEVSPVIFEAFGSMVAIPPVSLADAAILSERTGTMLVSETELSGDGTVLRERLEDRPVLLASEIANPAQHPELGSLVTLALSENPPMQAYLRPIWAQAPFRHWERSDGYEHVYPEPKKRRRALVAPGRKKTASMKSTGVVQGISNTRGWSESRIRKAIEDGRKKLDWDNTTGSARKWWEAFETENRSRLALVLRLIEELLNRKATITEFFLAYVYSNTDNIQANLCYLDYTRLKKEEEKKRRQRAAQEASKKSEQDFDDLDDEDEDEYDPFADE